jgi:hypothetical protein
LRDAGGGVNQALKVFEIEAPHWILLKDAAARHATARPAASNPPPTSEIEGLPETVAADNSAMKGFWAAIAIEAAVVLGAYLVWHF